MRVHEWFSAYKQNKELLYILLRQLAWLLAIQSFAYYYLVLLKFNTIVNILGFNVTSESKQRCKIWTQVIYNSFEGNHNFFKICNQSQTAQAYGSYLKMLRNTTLNLYEKWKNIRQMLRDNVKKKNFYKSILIETLKYS
jgi:hypothetical protein